MKLTFDDCVKLIWIYFAVKTALPILGRVIFKILDTIILRENSDFSKYRRERQEIENLNAVITDLEQQIEEKKAALEEPIRNKRIGFISNTVENS